MEQIIERALIDAGVRYHVEKDRAAAHHMDFDLPDLGIAIEVKQFHAERVGRQMACHENVIVAQGRIAVQLLADAIRGGWRAA